MIKAVRLVTARGEASTYATAAYKVGKIYDNEYEFGRVIVQVNISRKKGGWRRAAVRG